MRSIKISVRLAEHLRDICKQHDYVYGVRDLDAALRVAPKKFVVAAKKVRAKKIRAKRKDTRSIRALVMERADGVCECGCRTVFSALAPAELDHAFGRVMVKQSVSNTWALRRDCHAARTRNSPSAAFWLQKFINHTERHGFHEEFRMAARRLRSIEIQEEGPAGRKLISLDEELRIERAPAEEEAVSP